MRPRFSSLLVTILFFALPGEAHEVISYFSPGLCLSWNSATGLTFAPKFSIGYAWEGQFVNLTFTVRVGDRNDAHPLYIFETQGGYGAPSRVSSSTSPYIGGGIGIALQSDSMRVHLYPRVSAFLGFFIFATADAIFMDKIHIGGGAEVVFPLPLSKSSFGSIGG